MRDLERMLKVCAVYASGRDDDQDLEINDNETTTVTGHLTVQFYQGGAVNARVRQAKHLHIIFIREIKRARVATREAVIAA